MGTDRSRDRGKGDHVTPDGQIQRGVPAGRAQIMPSVGAVDQSHGVTKASLRHLRRVGDTHQPHHREDEWEVRERVEGVYPNRAEAGENHPAPENPEHRSQRNDSAHRGIQIGQQLRRGEHSQNERCRRREQPSDDTHRRPPDQQCHGGEKSGGQQHHGYEGDNRR